MRLQTAPRFVISQELTVQRTAEFRRCADNSSPTQYGVKKKTEKNHHTRHCTLRVPIVCIRGTNLNEIQKILRVSLQYLLRLFIIRHK